MKLSVKSRLLSHVAAINTKFKLTFVALILTLAGVGIFALVNRTSASTPGGATVNISKGYTYNYNGWTTSIYTISTSAGQFQGTCAEPTKSSPKWTNTATVLNNTGNSSYVAITRILLVSNSSYSSSMYSAFNNAYPNFWSNLSGSTGNGNPFVVGHVLIGKMYTGVYNFVTNTAALDNAINTINTWFNNNYPYEHLNWNLYSTYERGDTIQDIVWLEQSPQYAYINILKTDGDTGAALAGATLEFVGYSSAGRTVIATGLTTNAQGTLASPRRVTLGDSYTRYCFKETAAPSGYDINPNESCVSRSSLSEGATVNAEMSDTPTGSQKAKITVYKVDKDLAVGDYRSQGGAKLLGTRFIVQAVNNCTSKTPITNTSDPNYYYKELNIKWRDSTNNTGPFSTRHDEDGQGGNMVVGGSYIVKEKEDPNHPGMPVNGTGYKLNSDVACIDITDTQEQVTFKNEVMKGGFTLTKHKKIGNTETPFEGVTFHVRGTDSCGNNGCITSSFDVTTNASGVASVSPTDADALPYGHYTITEVCNATTAAYGCSYSEDFEITSDGQVVALNGGNPIVNTAKTPSISTVARECSSPASTPLQQLPITGTACAKDWVGLSNFVSGTNYKIEAALKSLDNGDVLKTVQTDWTHTASTTYKELEFANVDTNGYLGHKLYVTATVSMWDGASWIQVASFNTNGADEAELLEVSKYTINTTAAGVSGYKNSQGELLIGNVKVIDTVELGGLTQGTTYKIIGYITDGNRQAVTLKNGSTVMTMDYTMQASSGTVVYPDMVFEFDSTAYRGQTLEVHERLVDYNDPSIILVQHKGGPTQQVKVSTPTMSTQAGNKDNNDSKTVNIGSSVNVIDYVTFSNLVPYTDYTLKAEIYKTTDTSSPIATATKTFQPSAPDGTTSASQSPVLNFSTTGMASGTKLVVYEYLYAGNSASGTPFLTHTDVNDGNQQVTVSPIMMSTSAASKADGSTKVFNVGGDVTIMDTITLEGLAQGTTYKLKGWMIDARGNEINIKNGDGGGNTITQDYTMTATSGSQISTTMDFVIDTINYPGQSLTVCEQLLAANGTDEIISHCSTGDTNQTISVGSVNLATSAASKADRNVKEFNVGGNVVVEDVITLEGLVQGTTYRLKGWMVDSRGNEIEIENGTSGNVIIKNYTSTTGTQETTTMDFTIDTVKYRGQSLTVCEQLLSADGRNEIATHCTAGESAQTINVKSVSIRTLAQNADTGSKTINIGTVRVIDYVDYYNLDTNTDYTLRASIYKTSDLSNPVATATSAAFRPSSADGRTTAEQSPVLEFSTTSISGGTTLVVYEELYAGSTKIAEHKERNNSDQQVTISSITMGTTAARNDNPNIKEFNVGGIANIRDDISLIGLAQGTTYKIKGWMVDPNGNVVALQNGSEQGDLDNDPNTITMSYTMTEASGTEVFQVMNFLVDTVQYAGKKLTVYEQLLDTDGRVITSVESLANRNQTITINTPSIETIAESYDVAGAKTLNRGNVTVIDYVRYYNLNPGTKYWLQASIYKTSDLSTAVATSERVSFTPTNSSGRTPADSSPKLSFSTTEMAEGTQLVVYEYLYVDGVEDSIAQHTEVVDSQKLTVGPVTIATVATSKADASVKEFNVGGDAEIRDTIRMTGLVKNTTYKLQGWLVDANGNKVTLKNGGNDNTITQTFVNETATNAEVVRTMDFIVDSVAYYGKSLTVYEVLLDEHDHEIARHTEVNDDQTVRIKTPQIGTTAVQKGTTSHKLGVGHMEIRDTVTYANLTPGENYTLIGKVMRVAGDGSVSVLKINNVEITKTQTVTAQGVTGSWSMDFALYTRDIQGADLVVYEYLKHGNTEIAQHENPAVGDQNTQYLKVKTAWIRTLAKDGLESGSDQDDIIEPEADQKIEDTVTYSGLEPGTQYTITGKVMQKANGTVLEIEDGPLQVGGNRRPVTGQTTFTASSTGSGTVKMEFTFDATYLPGVELVVFEQLFEGTNTDGEYLLHHEDIDDDNQYIYVRPRIGTTAADAYDGDQMVGVGNATITDTIKYEGLREGGRYIMIGTLVDKETGEPVSSTTRCPSSDEEEGSDEEGDDGNSDESNDGGEGSEDDEDAEPEICVIHQEKVQSKVEFTIGSEQAPESDGEIEMLFELNTKDLVGKQLVVFEEVYEAEEYDEETSTPISWHKDLEDETQTVTIHTPEIKTFAMDAEDNDRELDNTGIVTITDKVEYSGLVAGTEYTVMGKVFDKETGEQIPFESGAIEEGVIEIAKGDSGYFLIDLPIKADDLAGRDVVVFEYLYIESLELDEETGEVAISEILLAKHEDLNDEWQTVHVKEKTPDTGHFGKREDAAGAAIIASSAIGVLTTISVAVVIVYRRGSRMMRRKKFGF